jgi:hypothetical protein
MRRRARLAAAALVLLGLAVLPGHAYVVQSWWADGDNIVFDDLFAPFNPWGLAAEDQLAEWNYVDTTDASHPFRISSSPDPTFGGGDGTSTMGFLDQAGLMAGYGLSYATALAWTVSWTSDGEMVEADIMVNPALPWSLGPDDSNWFQSTVLHEAGHARGLDHHQQWQSMMNDATSKLLRDEVLYMDDMNGVRQHASTVQEVDIAVYPKSHNTMNAPQWMSVSATTVREGQSVTFSNWSMENRGPIGAGDVPFRIYLSSSPSITPPLTQIGAGTFTAIGGATYRMGNWTSTIPAQVDCTTKYVGVDVPSNPAWNERFEQNNTVAFTNGSRAPVVMKLLLAQDAYEPNDSLGASRSIGRDFTSNALSLDSDTDQDWYSFYLPEAMTVVLDLSFTHARGDVDVTLHNVVGIILATSQGTTDQEHIQTRLSAGYYAIRVYGVDVGPCNRYAMTLHAYQCLQNADCPGAGDAICGSIFCNGITHTCAQIIPPCSDGDPCTVDFCYPVHGGYCMNMRDPQLDPDVDGVCGAADLCPYVADPRNLDSDGDGIGDACDTSVTP